MDAPMIPAATATIMIISIQFASMKVTTGLDVEDPKNAVIVEGSALTVRMPFA